MNDLLYKAMFGFLIADRQGVERNEAFKIGLLGSIDNSKGFMMPVLNAKFMADDKVEIENLKKEITLLRSEQTPSKPVDEATRKEVAVLQEEVNKLQDEKQILETEVENAKAQDANIKKALEGSDLALAKLNKINKIFKLPPATQ